VRGRQCPSKATLTLLLTRRGIPFVQHLLCQTKGEEEVSGVVLLSLHNRVLHRSVAMPTRRQRAHRPPFPQNALRGAMPGTYADLVPRDGSAGAFLPETEHVAGGVTERRHPQVPFGIGRLDDLATLRLDLLDGVVDAVDVDVGQQTWLA